MLLQESLVEMGATGQACPIHFHEGTELSEPRPLELPMDQAIPYALVVEFSEAVLLCWFGVAPKLWCQLYQRLDAFL